MSTLEITWEAPRTSVAREWVRQMIATIRVYRPIEGIARHPIAPRPPVRGMDSTPGVAAWPDGVRIMWPVGDTASRRR